MNFIALSSIERTPWANGGGFKRNLLKTPEVQISVADITQDGPFSFLPDQQRFFAVLSGAGVWLGTPEKELTANSEVFEFEGESAPACRLIAGPTEDLNTMVQRSSTRGSMQKHVVGATSYWTQFRAGEGVLAIYFNSQAVLTSVERTPVTVKLDRPGLFWQAGSSAPKQWQIMPANKEEMLTIYTIEGLAR